MTYSKLFNIKLTNTEIVYKIKINKLFKFRFITPDNVNGIKLKTFSNENVNVFTINNEDTSHLNWYIYDNNIDFSPLYNYKYIVLQLYTEEQTDCDEIENNDTFCITNQNEWYFCKDMGPTCGIEFYNVIIEKYKPMQEVDRCLKYKIYGDATIIKNNYIKAGTEDSSIIVTSFKSHVINYISEFVINKLKKNNNNIKNNEIPLILSMPINKETPNTENSDLNPINNKIEMIKFQLKNYFIENNNELTKINCSIDNQEEKNDNNKKKIGILDLRIDEHDINFEDIDIKLNNLNLDLDYTKDKIGGSDSIIDERFNNMKTIIDRTYLDISSNTTQITHTLTDHINKSLINSNTINKNNELVKEKTIKNQDDIIKINLDVNNEKITNNKKIKNINLQFDNLNSNFNYNLVDVDKKFSKLIYDLNNIKEFVDNKIEETILKFTSDNKTISETILKFTSDNRTTSETMNTHIQKNLEDIKLINDNNDLFKDEVLKNSNNLQEILDEKMSNLLNKCEDRLENIMEKYNFKNIWDNKNIYTIDCHTTNLTLQFMTIDKIYKSEHFYLFKDKYKKKTMPYYCWYIKEFQNGSSTAKLIPLVPLNSIYF